MRSPLNNFTAALIVTVLLASAFPAGAYPGRGYIGVRHSGLSRWYRSAQHRGFRPLPAQHWAPRSRSIRPWAARPQPASIGQARAATALTQKPVVTSRPAITKTVAAPAVRSQAPAPFKPNSVTPKPLLPGPGRLPTPHPVALSVSRPSSVVPAVRNPSPRPKRIPDYGGRDSAIGTTLYASGDAATLNPMAQAGRAFEALVIVLVLVVGGLYLLKRLGLVKADSKGPIPPPSNRMSLFPAGIRPGGAAPGASLSTEMLTVLGSQTLPDSAGAVLHVVSAGGRILLVGATAQSVTLLTELESLPITPGDRAEAPEAAFADYLARVGASPETLPVPVSRASQDTLASAADRLQSLLARRREEAHTR